MVLSDDSPTHMLRIIGKTLSLHTQSISRNKNPLVSLETYQVVPKLDAKIRLDGCFRPNKKTPKSETKQIVQLLTPV